MVCLGLTELHLGKGDLKGIISMDETTGTQLLACVWVDCDRRCFISTASSLADGETIVHVHWSQEDKTTLDAEPVQMEKRV